MHEVRAPLVSVTRSQLDDKNTRISYYSGDTLLLDMEILQEYVPATGPVDELMLVQLLVTPHEHMALLGDILAHSKSGMMSGPSWESLMTRIENLLLPPK